MNGYHGPERRATLSDDQIDAIAEKAAEKALQKVYASVGRGILNRLAWAVGAIVIGILVWMGGKGIPLK